MILALEGCIEEIYEYIEDSIVFSSLFNILLLWKSKKKKNQSKILKRAKSFALRAPPLQKEASQKSLFFMTHFFIVDEESDSWRSWRSHSMQIWSQDFSLLGASIPVSSDSRARWSHLVSLYSRRGYVIWCWSGDFSGKHIFSGSMMLSYFLEIVSGLSGIQRVDRIYIIAIRHLGISMISGRNIFWVYHFFCDRYLLLLFLFLLRSTREISRNSIISSRILLRSKKDFEISLIWIHRSSIRRQICSSSPQLKVLYRVIYPFLRSHISTLGPASLHPSVSILSFLHFSVCQSDVSYSAMEKMIPWKTVSSGWSKDIIISSL